MTHTASGPPVVGRSHVGNKKLQVIMGNERENGPGDVTSEIAEDDWEQGCHVVTCYDQIR